MPNFSILTIVGLVIAIIGVIAWVGGSLRVANLEINLETPKGRVVLIFSVLHILVGLLIIVISMVA
jgi:hypothetical protein